MNCIISILFIIVGTIIGVAFGTFILGLIVGAAVLFLFSKYRLKSKDEFEMLTKNEMWLYKTSKYKLSDYLRQLQ